jgi:hypothetical protein
MEIHPVSHHYQTGYMKRELIIIGSASLRQFYITQVLNVYKQKTPLLGGA